MSNCKKCRCKLTEYLGFNSIEPEIFCECCEGDKECPNPKEKSFEDYPNWDGIGSFVGIDRTASPVKRLGWPIPPSPTPTQNAPAGGWLTKQERIDKLNDWLAIGVISIDEWEEAMSAIGSSPTQRGSGRGSQAPGATLTSTD